MNILMFSDTYPPFINGVSTSVYNLFHTLRDHGNKVLLVTPAQERGEITLEDDVLYVPGFKLKRLYGYRVPKPFDTEVMSYIKKFKPDVIHYHTDSTLGMFARIVARRLKLPIVYTYHTSYEDYTYYVTHGFLDRAAKMIVRGYSKVIANGTTEFITPSEKTKDSFRVTGNDLNINVIPTGIDFSLFDDSLVDYAREDEFKKAHHIGPNTKVFLVLGRIAKEKSMDVSIRGFAQFLSDHKGVDARLLIVGGGPAREELELLTHQLNIEEYVDFIGPVPASDVPFYYHLADIYTSASISETQGLTFMEAMASGDLVLARIADNLTGTIIEGQTGFFFSDEKSFSLKAGQILSLSYNEKEKIKENELKIIDKYSIEPFYQNIIEVYNRAARKTC